jgi:single-stranded-DNA-specific exonuclease
MSAEPALVPEAAPQFPSAVGLRVVRDPAPPPATGDRPSSQRLPRLEIPSYDLDVALALERELGVSHVLAQALTRRGLTDPVAAGEFLEAREQHPPSAFSGIERALDRIERHIRDRTQITIHGDYDVDGVCATAVIVRALRALGANVDWFLPGRIEDGYGLSTQTVRSLAARGTRLLITVDCAITAVDEVQAAGELGVEVVVTDHHHPRADGALPECPVVHPGVCGYPCADLCGTGVALKLAQALGAPTVTEDLELVALATVADLMPLRGENRRLVREGLATLSSTAKPGLRALMAVANVDPSALDAQALGFRLAPRINAAGRLHRADAGLELLLTSDEARAAEIACELDEANSERRAVERQIAWEAEAQASELGERSGYVLAGESWHPGVIGIVASRIAERHHRPAILVALDGEGVCRGSARSIPGFDLLAALHACAEHLDRYGGHRAAAGLTIHRENVELLRVAFERHAETMLTPELRNPRESVDAVVSGSNLGLDLAEELELLEPTGVGNPRPRLLVPGGRFGELRAMGEGGHHARFSVTAGGTRTPAVAFGCDGRLGAAPGAPVNATFRLERNCWRGAVAPRLVLRHAWPCAAEPIEVLAEPREYLRAAIGELERQLEAPRPEHEAGRHRDVDAPRHGHDATRPDHAAARVALDRRGESPLAVLTDALAAGGPVLAVCADVPRRLSGLQARIGGFCLIAYHGLEAEAEILSGYEHVVALDPPASARHTSLLECGPGFTHLAWGEPELRFAEQMHELEYGLRASLVALYRDLRSRTRVAGEELERLLRGEGQHGRPARLAGRLIRVLAELELVSLDRDLPALAIAGLAPTVLDRSPAYRAYAKRYEDGKRFLSNSASLPPSSPAPAGALRR